MSEQDKEKRMPEREEWLFNNYKGRSMPDRVATWMEKVLETKFGKCVSRPNLNLDNFESVKWGLLKGVVVACFRELSKEEQVAVRLRHGDNLCDWYLEKKRKETDETTNGNA